MKILILPSNNALSHTSKALSVCDTLIARGHEPVLAVSESRSPVLTRLGFPHRILPDIQDVNLDPSPSFAWFKPKLFFDVIDAERRLIREVRPDAVLGIFRFTASTSAFLEGVPFSSLVCGCMLPMSREVLGFAEGESGIEEQRKYQDFFFGFCASALSAGLSDRGLPPVSDIRELLLGERTMLWDFPEFMPLDLPTEVSHVGPVSWSGWNKLADGAREHALSDGMILVSFGTGSVASTAVSLVVKPLLESGYQVALAAGGQPHLEGILDGAPGLTTFEFAPMDELLKKAAALVCHGGQLTVFEGLRREVPVMVMPFQPEQAHNGVCLERLGVGRRLIPPVASSGGPGNYIDSLAALPPGEISRRIRELTDLPEIAGRLGRVREHIDRYEGAAAVVKTMEGR